MLLIDSPVPWFRPLNNVLRAGHSFSRDPGFRGCPVPLTQIFPLLTKLVSPPLWCPRVTMIPLYDSWRIWPLQKSTVHYSGGWPVRVLFARVVLASEINSLQHQICISFPGSWLEPFVGGMPSIWYSVCLISCLQVEIMMCKCLGGQLPDKK